ncbi:hypothetical protein Tco_1006521 [Tanacetum coccineum]|uniref:Uncharacterized protein n=1 Tax=Tanacetum coccineum TaxID=301880 RepID=A0ABQ5FJC0_9ASTR
MASKQTCLAVDEVMRQKDGPCFSSSGPLKIGKYLHFSLCSGTKTKEGLWKELQFSLVGNSKLNVDFQDSLDDEEDTRSSHEYPNDLEEEYQARALLAKSKRFFKKGTQSSSQHKPELRPTKDFEAKYNKVKAKLTLLSLSASASKAVSVKNKGLIAKAYEWDEE